MIGKRLKLGRKAKGLALREVGEAMGVTPQAVAQWEKTNPEFSAAKTNAIANIIAVDYMWLEGDIGVDNEVVFDTKTGIVSQDVPFIDRREAIAFMLDTVSSGRSEFSSRQTLLPSVKIIGQGFAFRMDDQSMSPLICEGDILIFDPAKPKEFGDVAFVMTIGKSGNAELNIRTIEDARLEDGTETWILTSPNPDAAVIDWRASFLVRVIAVLVEIRLTDRNRWMI